MSSNLKIMKILPEHEVGLASCHFNHRQYGLLTNNFFNVITNQHASVAHLSKVES